MTGTTVLTTGNTDYNALELIRACAVYTGVRRNVSGETKTSDAMGITSGCDGRQTYGKKNSLKFAMN